MIRIVIDTNLYVSALINENSRVRLNRILDDPRYEIVMDDILFAEIEEVIFRAKFARMVSKEQIESFLSLLRERCVNFATKSKVRHSPDPKDDFLLALCLDSYSHYLVTGNKIDLLALKRFGETEILSLTELLAKTKL